jgi:hypothetical protein
MTTRIEKMENLLSRFRAQKWEESSDERKQQPEECLILYGAIEDLKVGRTSVLPAAQRYAALFDDDPKRALTCRAV